MLKKIALFKLVLIAIVLVSVVLSYIPDKAYHLPGADIAEQNFHVIEFNDHGEPHDPDQWAGLAARLARHGDKPSELIIFIHGWHHSASPDDENFIAFQQFYQQMAKSDAERNLVALYIGWRGDKYDPLWLDGSDDATSWVEPLDFPTIFQRKTVARRIGKTGFSQLLDKLDAEVAAGRLQRYTVIGHSLGGAVALHGSKDRIKQSIEQHKDNPNLFILLNPAVTAREYRPMDELLSLDRQKPAMVVLQSKGDFALKEAFNWLKEGERAMGNSWAITHDIDRCPRGDCSIKLNIPLALQQHDATPGCKMTLPNSGWIIRARLQARRTVQTCPDANMQAVWVLAVSDDIISGHNGILTEQHAFALSEVMGMIDFYRNQLPKQHVEQQATPLEPEHQQPPADTEPQHKNDKMPQSAHTEPDGVAADVAAADNTAVDATTLNSTVAENTAEPDSKAPEQQPQPDNINN
ncbi:lipase family protein [Rheinheimera sp. 4Y26]|uniref:lipase family protein n=1 Tax=Rheinheimera sp. 4Y26 TaxID=2977811 RepID=UPI0021B11032|nr:lipase family protein [Rheinheimera sp. 4Y26]MCT6699761.1 lipase family protein [Rheinheimera sp. 4Y26]